MKIIGLMRLGPLVLSALFCLLFAPGAQAITETITAVFRPDPSNPGSNQFVNTAPMSGMCLSHAPAACKQLGIISLRIPYPITSSGPVLANHANERQGVMYKVPSSWRTVSVTHVETGQTEELEFRIAAIGGRWDVPRELGVPGKPGVSGWGRGPAFGEPRWDLQWKVAPAPCQSTGAHASWINFALFFWVVPEGAGTCSRQPTMDFDWVRTTMIEYGYELRTPNPLKMAAGQYTGTAVYSMGPGGDFDFGDLLVPPDNQLTYNFVLEVDHHLKVEVPPGGHRVELAPAGGWKAWLNRGRKPERLFRDQTVNLWASSQFKMTLECSLQVGNTCGIANQSGYEVPLDVAVSLPYGLHDASGAPVNRRPLRLDGVGTELFQPTQYVNRRPSTLHFEVNAAAVAQMLEQSDTTYTGQVTVVWDSEV